MRCFILIPGILLLSLLTEFQLYSQEKTLIKKVVIDAGHGGKDPGAPGKKTHEKYITLSLALKLGEMIRKECPDVTVYYTRDRDEFIELHQRTGLANKKKADLFISIHCNSNPSSSFRGAETYVMGLHRSEANLAIAKLENAAILMEPDYTNSYDGFDPNSAESYITFSLFQNIFLEQSTDFATLIQNEMKNVAGLNDRGVRQAGFLVLYRSTMPSVLVEAGFLSNPEEEKFLISSKGQESIASAIFRAFKKFKAKMEGATLSEKKEEKSIASGEGIEPEVSGGKTPEKIKKQSSIKESVIFRIQVLTSPTDIGIKSRKLSGLKDVKMYRHQGMFKYTTGEFCSLEEALKLQEEVQKNGFKDAFVAAFTGEKRISIVEAKKILGKQSGQ